ncbi:hypothetical protein EJB05_26575, partial [Eragrostis curvula]
MELVIGASMRSVLVKLEDILSQDHKLIRDVLGEVQCINSELGAIHASFISNPYLRDRGNHDGEQKKCWARRVCGVVYETEDWVDHVRLRISSGGMMSPIRRAWYAISTLHSRRGIPVDITGLMIRVQRLRAEGCARYGVGNPQLSSDNTIEASTSAQRVDHGTPPAPLLMGMEEPVGMSQAMVDFRPWLTAGEQDRELKVTTIVGCGGLGKSTLAKALCREFGAQFGSRATVLASREFSLGDFLRSLLKQIMSPSDYDELQLGGFDGWTDDELREKVEEQFLEKRFIIVIEDVWSEDAWKSIRESLPENDKSSRLVVTTRLPSVAQAICGQQGFVYSLNPLSGDDSYRLLQRILGDSHMCPCGTDSDVSRILDKCGGLPMAIIAVAGILANRLASDFSLTEVCASVSSEMEHGISHEEITKKIFSISYNDLPAHLKTCLLSLSVFPEGFAISRKRVIRRWIVEGFITEKHGKTVEQVAKESFSELFRRKLIHPAEISSIGEVKTFQVQNVILENIVSESTEENFITVLSNHSPVPVRNKVRWLSIHQSSKLLCPTEGIKRMNLVHVRSLTVFGTLKHVDCFEIMQVLDLEGCRGLGKNQLILMCKMYLLKYLSLRRTYIKALPDQIQNLKYLETLDIRETNVQRLPGSAGHLKQMVHLRCGDRRRGLALLLTKAITKMIELQTLSGIMICRGSRCALNRMPYLTKLKKLSIYGIRLYRVGPEFLSHSSSLTSLAIDDGFTGFLEKLELNSFRCPEALSTLKLSGKLSEAPLWIRHMECLEGLTLSLTSLTTDSLVLLSSLPKLCFLTFSTAKRYIAVSNEREIFVRTGGFPCLHTLRFSGTWLPLLSFLQGAMPGLLRLELRFKSFDGIYGLENLCSLHKVHLQISCQASKVAQEKVHQIQRSVIKHPRGPTMVCDEYPEW